MKKGSKSKSPQAPSYPAPKAPKPPLSKLSATCGIDYDIGHYPFFIVSQEPHHGKRIIPFKGGYWEFLSGDFPNYNDLDVLLGVVRLFEMEAKIGRVFEAGEVGLRKAMGVEVSGRTLCSFVGVAASGQNLRTIDG